MVINISKSRANSTVLSMLLCCSFSANALAQCRVSYPVVLTHHWGMKPLCASAPDEECDRLVPGKYCQEWRWDEVGQDLDCMSWRVPHDELDLPPRNYNVVNQSLQRDVSGYYRYFSQDIVQRLSEQCDNQVFIADNPAFSSSLVRAQSLRHTVLQALESSNADKVIIIGMSQGSQDARMLTQLAVDSGQLIIPDDSSAVSRSDDENRMASKIAALVTVVGENEGSWSASVFLNTMYAQRYLVRDFSWSNYESNLLWQFGKNKVMAGLWKNERGEYVLSEMYLKAQTEADIYQHFLASNLVLTKKYMTGEAYSWVSWEQSWDELQAAAGLSGEHWNIVLPTLQEGPNAISYYSYAAEVHGWNKDWGQSRFVANLVTLLEGKHDGYATVRSQSLQGHGQHVKTMSGLSKGSGYHHMFFSGRNDALYGPKEENREPDLYRGSSADFYQQIMTNLVHAGF